MLLEVPNRGGQRSAVRKWIGRILWRILWQAQHVDVEISRACARRIKCYGGLVVPDVFPFVFRVITYIVLALRAKRAGILAAEELREIALAGHLLVLPGSGTAHQEQSDQTRKNPGELAHGGLLFAAQHCVSPKRCLLQGEHIFTGGAAENPGPVASPSRLEKSSEP